MYVRIYVCTCMCVIMLYLATPTDLVMTDEHVPFLLEYPRCRHLMKIQVPIQEPSPGHYQYPMVIYQLEEYSTHVFIYIHTYIHKYVHTYIHTYIHTGRFALSIAPSTHPTVPSPPHTITLTGT